MALLWCLEMIKAGPGQTLLLCLYFAFGNDIFLSVTGVNTDCPPLSGGVVCTQGCFLQISLFLTSSISSSTRLCVQVKVCKKNFGFGILCVR